MILLCLIFNNWSSALYLAYPNHLFYRKITVENYTESKKTRAIWGEGHQEVKVCNLCFEGWRLEADFKIDVVYLGVTGTRLLRSIWYHQLGILTRLSTTSPNEQISYFLADGKCPERMKFVGFAWHLLLHMIIKLSSENCKLLTQRPVATFGGQN